MAVSDTADFILTRSKLLAAVLRKVTGELNTADAGEVAVAAEALNLVVKSLQNHSVFLWTSGLTQVTQTNGVITFADDIVGVDKAFRRRDGADRELTISPWAKWLDVTDKSQTGDPLRLFFQYSRDGLSTGQLYPLPDSPTEYTYFCQTIRKLKDFDTNENNPDFPARWYEYLIYQTAYRLAPEYGLPIEERRMLKADADECFILARKQEFERTDDNFVEPI